MKLGLIIAVLLGLVLLGCINQTTPSNSTGPPASITHNELNLTEVQTTGLDSVSNNTNEEANTTNILPVPNDSTMEKAGCQYNNPICYANQKCIQNSCENAIPNISGSYREVAQFVLPQKVYAVKDWSISINPSIAFKNSQIKFIISTDDYVKIGNIADMKASLMQLNTGPNGLGKTEDILVYNDGTHGDELSNDRYFTTTMQASEWYDLVTLAKLDIKYRDNSSEILTPMGVNFFVYDLSAEAATVYETDHAISILPKQNANAAKVLSNGVELCYPGLNNQIGSFDFKFGKVYYSIKIQQGYLETGGDINKFFSSQQTFDFMDPTAPENRFCSPITSHELTHSIFTDVRMPRWADEGLAEYTSQKIDGKEIICEDNGWRQTSIGTLNPFESISQSQWHGSGNQYMAGVCAFRYIETAYGEQVIRTIYNSLKTKRSNAFTSYCTNGYNFYQDVLVTNTNSDVLNVLKNRFGISEEEMHC